MGLKAAAVRLLLLLVVACAAHASFAAEQFQLVSLDACGSIQVAGQNYNLDYLAANGPYSLPVDEYTYLVAVCNTIAAPCINSVDTNSSACGNPNQASICQVRGDLFARSRCALF